MPIHPNGIDPKPRYMTDMLVYWIKDFELDGYCSNAAAEVPTSWTASTDAGRADKRSERVVGKSGRMVLNLGTGKEIAELSVDGQAFGGILWKPLYQAEVTDMLKPWHEPPRIKATNLWPNRIIGDQQTDMQKKFTWTDHRPYTKDSPLMESGLPGPVTLSTVSVP